MDFLRVGSCDNAIVFFLFYNEGKWNTVPWQAGKIKVEFNPTPNWIEPVKNHSTRHSVHNKCDIWASICTSVLNFWPMRGRVMHGAYWGTASTKTPQIISIDVFPGSSNLAWKVGSLLPTCHGSLLLIQEH